MKGLTRLTLEHWLILNKDWFVCKDPGKSAWRLFLSQKKSVVIDVVIPALMKLVSRDTGGRTSCQAEEFGLILEESNIHKTYSL